jgi:hypothetical protein
MEFLRTWIHTLSGPLAGSDSSLPRPSLPQALNWLNGIILVQSYTKPQYLAPAERPRRGDIGPLSKLATEEDAPADEPGSNGLTRRIAAPPNYLGTIPRRYSLDLFFNFGPRRLYVALLDGVPGYRSRLLWVKPWIDSWRGVLNREKRPRA